ncbi:MAG: DHHA1 domain-containing protein [Anaerolineae bacterium]|nr:DHHA1 domain-containing protein [Anaerolineae bacterium]
MTRLENRGSITRVEFLCGKRALDDYRAKNNVLANLAQMLTVGYWELDQGIERLQSEGKQARRELRRAREELVYMESEELVRSAVDVADCSVVSRVWSGREAAEIRSLAQVLAQSAGVVALLACVNDDRTHLCFSRADDLDLNVAELLQEACQQLGGKGGGRPHLAQGSTSLTDVARVESVVASVASMMDE